MDSNIEKEELEGLILILGDMQGKYTELGDKFNDPMRGFELCQMVEIYKCPLLFAWQKYKYGYHFDFWEEGDSMFTYEQFEINMHRNPKDFLDDIITTWKANSPLQFFGEVGEEVSNRILKVYEALKSNMELYS